MISLNPPIKNIGHYLSDASLDSASLIKQVKVKETTLRNYEFSHSSWKRKLNKEGYAYLLPHEVWNTKKIFITLDVIGKKLDYLVSNNKLNKETLKEIIEEAVPESKDKIIIKDFSDFKQDMKAGNYSPEYIEHLVSSSAAMTSYDPKLNKNILYFKFEKLNPSNFDKITQKVEIEHELEHAFKMCYTNAARINTFKNEAICKKKNSIFNRIFIYFELNYGIGELNSKMEMTSQNLLKKCKKNSIAELHSDFKTKLNEAFLKEKTSKDNLFQDKKQQKQFYSYMQDTAQDEKHAYRSNIRYREYFNDIENSTNIELQSLMYEEMEKMFHNEKLNLFDNIHKSRGKINVKA